MPEENPFVVKKKVAVISSNEQAFLLKDGRSSESSDPKGYR